MGNKMKPRNSLGGGGCSVPLPGGARGPGLPAPLTAALSLPLQKKKGKEAGSGAALPAPRVPALPPEARAPHSSSPAAAKRSKAKAKGKEVKKEVRLAAPSGQVPPAPHGPPGVGVPRSPPSRARSTVWLEVLSQPILPSGGPGR